MIGRYVDTAQVVHCGLHKVSQTPWLLGEPDKGK